MSRSHLYDDERVALLRRPASHEALASSHLHPRARSRKRKSLGADSPLIAPRPSRASANEPTLLELMRAEERRLESEAQAEGQTERDGAIGDHHWDSQDYLSPPESAVLYPPLYGRPAPTPSPDIFAELLKPLLSLSRPPSPAPTPPLGSPHQSPYFSSTTSSPHLDSSHQAPSTPTGTIPVPAASSLPAHFPPRTPSDPGPTVESQGFVLYLGSLLAWWAYLIWSFSPEWLLEKIGVAWYPSREWALLVPAWTIMLAFFVYFSYLALNIFITPSLDSLHTLTDPQALVFPLSAGSKHHPLIEQSILLPDDAVPPLHDLPIGLVNRVVLGDFRRQKTRVRSGESAGGSVAQERQSEGLGLGFGHGVGNDVDQRRIGQSIGRRKKQGNG